MNINDKITIKKISGSINHKYTNKTAKIIKIFDHGCIEVYVKSRGTNIILFKNEYEKKTSTNN